jgi:hypothetical protein
MKNILLIIILVLSLNIKAQAPSNDCAESPLIINSCGTDFTVTQTQMSNATADSGCQAGGSCPITYVNGVGYEDLDCDGDDDWTGTIENSLFWSFTTTQSCTYTVSVSATNCCCREKGSTNAAQVQIYNTTATLPGGDILGNIAGDNNFTGTVTFNINVTAGNPVLIVLDGLEGSDCDIAVSVQPSTGCIGCTLLEYIYQEPIKEDLKAPERIKTETYYDISGRIINSSNLKYGIYFKYVTLKSGKQYIEKILIL